MSKANRSRRSPAATAPAAPAAPAATAAPAAPAAPAATAPVIVVRVVAQPAKTYRENSARGQYWAAVQAHDGQPVTEVAAAMLGTGAKTTAATNSWLAWFAKQGLITIGV